MINMYVKKISNVHFVDTAPSLSKNETASSQENRSLTYFPNGFRGFFFELFAGELLDSDYLLRSL